MLRIFKFKMQSARPFLSEANKARDHLQWTQAASAYRRFLLEHPDAQPIWIQLGHALKESGSLDEAERAYTRAIEISPRDADAHLQIGHIYKMTARLEQARLSYELSYFLDPALGHARDEVLRMRAHQPNTASSRPLLAAGSFPDAIAELDLRLNAVASQVDHILSHVAITKALGAELARLSRRIEQERTNVLESARP